MSLKTGTICSTEILTRLFWIMLNRSTIQKRKLSCRSIRMESISCCVISLNCKGISSSRSYCPWFQSCATSYRNCWVRDSSQGRQHWFSSLNKTDSNCSITLSFCRINYLRLSCTWPISQTQWLRQNCLEMRVEYTPCSSHGIQALTLRSSGLDTSVQVGSC
jgi:hypothetical protein